MKPIYFLRGKKALDHKTNLDVSRHKLTKGDKFCHQWSAGGPTEALVQCLPEMIRSISAQRLARQTDWHVSCNNIPQGDRNQVLALSQKVATNR
jgi:hypothetical protein